MAQSPKIIKNSIALMGGRLYHAALNLVVIGLIARYLKVDGFGQYAFVMAVCTIFMAITDMGINRICIREMSKDLSKANDIFWASSFVKCLLSVITFLCIASTINIVVHDEEVVSAAYVCAGAVICFFLGDIFSAIFVAFEKMVYIGLLSFAQITSYLTFVILFIQFDFGLRGIFYALLFSYVIRLFFGVLLTCKNFFRPRLNLDFALSYYLIREGLPIGAHKVLRKITFRFDTILIKLIRSPAEVGIFHGAYRIILVFTLIPQSIAEALFPMISRVASESKESLGRVLEQSFKLLLIVVIPLLMALIFLSEDIIRLVLGESFLQAVPALMVFSGVWGIMAFNELLTRFLHASYRQIFVTVAAIVALVINIFLDIILIYRFGYFGAVIATLLAEMSFFTVACRAVKKYGLSISWRTVLPKPILAAVPMAMAMYLLHPVGAVLSVPCGLGLFLVGIFALGVLEPNEIAIVKESFHRAKIRFSQFSVR